MLWCIRRWCHRLCFSAWPVNVLDSQEQYRHPSLTLIRSWKTGSKSSNFPSWKGYTEIEHWNIWLAPSIPVVLSNQKLTGNFHFDSQSCLMPSWCTIFFSYASFPIRQLLTSFFGSPASPSSTNLVFPNPSPNPLHNPCILSNILIGPKNRINCNSFRNFTQKSILYNKCRLGSLRSSLNRPVANAGSALL